jgi:hypothetical protein
MEILADREGWQWCSEYGEPGYGDSRTTSVVLGDYWCRCSKVEGLHDYSAHYPRLFARAALAGIELEWCDEWIIDYETDKAYRTTGDSYSWQTSVLFTEYGDILTPDSDPADLIEHALESDNRALSSRFLSVADIEALGFVRWPDDETTHESGWFPGQTDDPKVIADRIRAEHGDDVEIISYITSVGQFDLSWITFYRLEGES